MARRALSLHGIAISLALIVCWTPVPAEAQAEIAFEVVSIKPSRGRVPLAMSASCVFRGVQWRCAGATLQGLMTLAFRFGSVAVERSQIVDGPDWIATSQFEITAALNTRVEPGQFSSRLPALLRPVLEDRFNLRTHVERRPVQVYALVRAFKDGRLGPQLREAATNCPPVPSEMASKRPVPAAPIEKVCWGGDFQMGSIRAGAITMRALAAHFTNAGVTDRIVLDRTDLRGNFAIDLRWSPTPLGAVTAAGRENPDLLDQPSLFAALQEQLGLKLEPRTEVIDVLVIDHVELPTPN
jgi:uncharacterized protein (TIGR03435 family)